MSDQIQIYKRVSLIFMDRTLTKNQILEETKYQFYEYVRYMNFMHDNSYLQQSEDNEGERRFMLTDKGVDFVREIDVQISRSCIVCGKIFIPHARHRTDDRGGRRRKTKQLTCGSKYCRFYLKNHKSPNYKNYIEFRIKIEQWKQQY